MSNSKDPGGINSYRCQANRPNAKTMTNGKSLDLGRWHVDDEAIVALFAQQGAGFIGQIAAEAC